jgi:hypothetical protein
MYTDPSGHIGVLALLLHPAVVVVVAVVAVALIVNNILPGRDERIATTANAIESGIAWASNTLRPRYRKPNKREQEKDDIIGSLQNPSSTSSSSGPIEVCKTIGGKFLCGIFIAGVVTKIVTSGANGEDGSNSHIVLSSHQPDTTFSGETFITAPQYPLFDGYVPEVIDLGPFAPKLEIPNIVPQKPANQEIFHPSPIQLWGGGGGKPVMY